MALAMRFDYTAVGHVTIDILEDGTRRVGGSAFYAGLQAARLGMRTLVVTQGRRSEIEPAIEAYRDELELHVNPAADTTTLETLAPGERRRQRLLAWAGPIALDSALDTAILHLAPIARETPAQWRGDAGFVGVTAQGLIRHWPARGGEISHVELSPQQLPDRSDAVVLNETERRSCRWLLARPAAAEPRGEAHHRALVAITAGPRAVELHLPDGSLLGVDAPVPPTPVRDDVGAGDVFAAALFVALHEGKAPKRAALFAHAAAGLRVAGIGPAAIASRSVIESRLRERA
jgi:sugar/nucleoside kinase (ribokinase family)